MPLLGRHQKTSVERERYSVDYTDWLDTGETITRVEFVVITPSNAPISGSPIQVDAYQISADQKSVAFFVSFGDTGINYTVDVRITTSGGQVKEDTVAFSVRNV